MITVALYDRSVCDVYRGFFFLSLSLFQSRVGRSKFLETMEIVLIYSYIITVESVRWCLVRKQQQSSGSTWYLFLEVTVQSKRRELI